VGKKPALHLEPCKGGVWLHMKKLGKRETRGKIWFKKSRLFSKGSGGLGKRGATDMERKTPLPNERVEKKKRDVGWGGNNRRGRTWE